MRWQSTPRRPSPRSPGCKSTTRSPRSTPPCARYGPARWLVDRTIYHSILRAAAPGWRSNLYLVALRNVERTVTKRLAVYSGDRAKPGRLMTRIGCQYLAQKFGSKSCCFSEVFQVFYFFQSILDFLNTKIF